MDDEVLLSYGVPDEWLAKVKAANEHSLFELVAHLPQEVAEALLELSWPPATTKSYHSSHELRQSPTTVILKRSTTPNGTCFTWHAPGHANSC